MEKLLNQLKEVEDKLYQLYLMGGNDEKLVDELRRLQKLIREDIDLNDWKLYLPEGRPENECLFCGEECDEVFCSTECAKSYESEN